MMRSAEIPRFKVIDKYTVSYTWKVPNPYFLPALAAPRPLFIYMPAHYMKQFHADYLSDEESPRKSKQPKSVIGEACLSVRGVNTS